jgi:hypothetical protein
MISLLLVVMFRLVHFVGLALICYGIWRWNPIAGYIFAGVIMATVGSSYATGVAQATTPGQFLNEVKDAYSDSGRPGRRRQDDPGSRARH